MSHVHQAIKASHSDRVPLKRALISVFDKTGVVELATALSELGVQLVSTGGTARRLRDAGLQVVDVSEVTGFPEILNGRVKSLHPAIHGALLAVRGNPAHAQELAEHHVQPIDLVVGNLYPFQDAIKALQADTARDQEAVFDGAVENVDIGGPCMIRSAAKNSRAVAVLTHPAQYDDFVTHVRACGGASEFATRRKLAGAAFALTAAYDTAIAQWFSEQQE